MESQFDWTVLESPLESGSVIPIIGRELLIVEGENGPIPLDHLVGERLAVRLGVNVPDAEEGSVLNAVALAYLDQGGTAKRIYPHVHAIIRELEDRGEVGIPESLRLLARMDCFKLYVTTTFDSLLVKALQEERAGGGEIPHLQYAMRLQVKDLPAPIESLDQPVVYSLLGTVAGTNTYVVTELDMLEVLHALQEAKSQLPRLFDAFRNRSLLFIGCGYQNWLARFFIRTVQNKTFSEQRHGMEVEVVADERARTDTARTLFLQRHEAQVFMEGDAVTFVRELYDHWEGGRGPGSLGGGGSRAGISGGAIDTSRHDVFLSYAREDAEHARRVRDALVKQNLTVFLDTSEQGVKPGDQFEHLLRSALNDCAVIVPLISNTTERRQEAFFRREWSWAESRREGCDRDYRLIQPLVLDPSIDPKYARVPQGFRDLDWRVMESGKIPDAFLESVQDTARMIRAQKAGY